VSIFQLLGSLALTGGLALLLLLNNCYRIQPKFCMSILRVLLISPHFHGCGCPLEPTSFWLAAIRHPCLSLGSGTRLRFPPVPFGVGFTPLRKVSN